MNKKYIIITLRKEVENLVAAQTVYELVKTRLEDREDVQIQGHYSEHFELEAE